MLRRPWAIGWRVLLALTAGRGSSIAQEAVSSSGQVRPQAALRVFLDCGVCDADFVHTVVGFVLYVRDPAFADVHVLVTDVTTGSGGQIATARFIGRAAFAGVIDTLAVGTSRDASSDDQRRALAQLLSIGLAHFMARVGLAGAITVSAVPGVAPSTVSSSRSDPWNAWVYSVGLAGTFTGQQYAQSTAIAGSITADRVTQAWRVDLAINDTYSASSVHADNVDASTVERALLATAQVAKSLTSHWSGGGLMSVSSSTFLNEAMTVHLAPAVEYDVFPYEQASHHQLTFLYAIGGTFFRYIDRTIFDRRREVRADQTLTVALAATEPWGSLGTSLQGAAFLDNIRQNRIVLSGAFRVRLFSGFTFDVEPAYSAIRDQIYLPAGTQSRDDILLARRQLATGYQFGANIGFTFTFGSRFNGVVNPRFNRAVSAGTGNAPY